MGERRLVLLGNMVGNSAFMDPFTGNAAIGYARLDIREGQKRMWDKPWMKEQVEEMPWVDGMGFGEGVGVLRGA